MGIFDKKMEPVFLKDSSETKEQLIELARLLVKATGEIKLNIEKDIKLLSYGIVGEENIAFELKNSHIPMYVLHDVYIEDEDLSAQIDYLVITQKRIFVIECKNLYGDIEVNSSGDFVRTIAYNGKKFKEGIYSPITQNKRHLDLLRIIRAKRNNNLLTKALFEKYFDDFYKSIVVLANPKTILNMKYATKETKSKVIRGDQLIQYIKKVNLEPGVENSSLKSMEELAQSFLEMCVDNKMDYTKKYKDILDVEDAGPSVEEDIAGKKETETKQNVELVKLLKAYRLNKSREENVKPYFLFNDRQLDDLLCKMPKSKDELKGVSGFGDIKCEKYGNEIISIINKVV
jgi:hypothetical protein